MDNDTGQIVLSLREYLAQIIEPLRKDISELRSAVSKLAVNESEFQYLREQCETHKREIASLTDRVEALENYHKVGMWVFRMSVGVATAVGTAALIAYFVG